MKICKVTITGNWHFGGGSITGLEMDAVRASNGFVLIDFNSYMWIPESDCVVLKEKDFKFEDDSFVNSSNTSLLGAIGGKPQELIIKF